MKKLKQQIHKSLIWGFYRLISCDILKKRIKMDKTSRIWKKTLLSFLLTVLLFFLIGTGKSSLFDIVMFLVWLLGLLISFLLLIEAIIYSYRTRVSPSKWILLSLILLTISIPTYKYYQDENFTGKIKLEAAFIDERSRMDLVLYENGKYEIISNWLMGTEKFTGNYKIYKDTIEFEKFPVVENDFVSKKIVVQDGKIYFRRNKLGKYDTSFYYFQIDYEKNKTLKQ